MEYAIMKTASKLPDPMQRIEDLREASRNCTDEERADLSRQREALRNELRDQRHREHMADMERAQAMPEVCNFAPLDPAPHRRHHVPERSESWLTPIAACAALCCIAVLFLLQWFGVLLP
jgi:ferric-dicitrate binding protein FerR (iron transport regulator)